MPELNPLEEPLYVHNLRVLFLNWLPAFGCLTVGVVGMLVGVGSSLTHATVQGALYLLAGAAGFAAFGWVWRRE